MVKIKILKGVVVAGIARQAGEVVEVTNTLAEELISLERAELYNEPEPSAIESKKEEIKETKGGKK